MQVPSSLAAFTTPCLTPERSAGGWTRGMPPPAHAAAQGRRRPAAAAAASGVVGGGGGGGRRAPRLTATAGPPAATPLPPPMATTTPAPLHPPTAADGASSTVDAYLRPEMDQDQSHQRTPPAGGGGSRSRTADALQVAAEATRGVHGGERVRGGKKAKAVSDAIITPIVQSSTFTFQNTRECIEYNQGIYESFEYGRYGNPTTRAAEEKLMALEKAEDALFSASGMNAVTTMLLALVPEGGHIVTTTDCYRRTRQFVNTVLPKMKIRTTVIDPADLDSLQAIFESQGATVFFSESPTNPLIRVVDTPAITKLCARYGVISVIDTTFATPINYRAIEHGADLVLHSGTKYLAGHHDVLCGAIAGRADLVQEVRRLHGVLGGVIDPHAAFLVLRGMKTLALRMQAHNRNAESLAEYLTSHPKIARVHYPTLESHIDYAVASRLFPVGFGGVLSFELAGDGNPWSRETFEATGRFVDALCIPYIGPSLGGCESLVEQVSIMGYFDQPLHERKRLGITNGLIRFAAGIECHHDLINDVEQALGHA